MFVILYRNKYPFVEKIKPVKFNKILTLLFLKKKKEKR